MSLLTVNTAELRTIQVNETISDSVSIPSSKSAMIIGPVSITNLTINGHLNVIQSLNVTNELNIVGSISFSG